MGPTGSGKSAVRITPRHGLFSGPIVNRRGISSFVPPPPLPTQFINLVSGSNLGIGSELESCTKIVQPGNPFILDGRRVVLVDTPGFDDTTRSDIDVLNMIAVFLATS
jgi:hypothetical protein